MNSTIAIGIINGAATPSPAFISAVYPPPNGTYPSVAPASTIEAESILAVQKKLKKLRTSYKKIKKKLISIEQACWEPGGLISRHAQIRFDESVKKLESLE